MKKIFLFLATILYCRALEKNRLSWKKKSFCLISYHNVICLFVVDENFPALFLFVCCLCCWVAVMMMGKWSEESFLAVIQKRVSIVSAGVLCMLCCQNAMSSENILSLAW